RGRGPGRVQGEGATAVLPLPTPSPPPRWRGPGYCRFEPTLLNLLDALLPRKAIATMQTTAMRATRRAYSTRLAPRSSRPNFARRYGAQCCCQYATISMNTPIVSTPRRRGLLLSLHSSAEGVRGSIGLSAHCADESPQRVAKSA